MLVDWGRVKPDTKHDRFQVQKDVSDMLAIVAKADAEVFNLLFWTITQGVGHAAASNETHAEGWCVDFSFKHPKWDRAHAERVYRALKPYFAVAYRAAGEVGKGVNAHCHIARHGRANSAAIIAANQGDSRIEHRIKQIFPA